MTRRNRATLMDVAAEGTLDMCLDIEDALRAAAMPAAALDVIIVANHLRSLGWVKEDGNADHA